MPQFVSGAFVRRSMGGRQNHGKQQCFFSGSNGHPDKTRLFFVIYAACLSGISQPCPAGRPIAVNQRDVDTLTKLNISCSMGLPDPRIGTAPAALPIADTQPNKAAARGRRHAGPAAKKSIG